MKKCFGLTCLIGILFGTHPSYAIVCDPNYKGCNTDHHIGVYYMNTYEQYDGQPWKGYCGFPVGDPRSPYDSFYDAMKDGCYDDNNPTQNAKCAHIYSLRRQSQKTSYLGGYKSHYEFWPWQQWIDYVKPYNMIKNATSDEDPDKGWGKYDLVFFYGHNSHIKPTYPSIIYVPYYPYYKEFEYWVYNGGYSWLQQEGSWASWGTQLMPYWYHYNSPITNAEPYPYIVFYATDPFTSVLVGKDFNPNGFLYESTWDQEFPLYASNSLGYPDTKWIIAHGCAALPVVSYADGITPLSNGKIAWSRYWYRIHIVMGHNSGIYGGQEPDLVGCESCFSELLLSGAKMQKAYFDIHDHPMQGGTNDGWPTALSAENDNSRFWTCYVNMPWICFWLYYPNSTMMATDDWTSPNAAITSPTWWYTRWKSYISTGSSIYSTSTSSSTLSNSTLIDEIALESEKSSVENAGVISITSPSAIALVGDSGIAIRQKNFYAELRNVPALYYTTYDNTECRSMSELVASKFGFQEIPDDFRNSFRYENEDATLSFSMSNNTWDYRMKNAPIVPMNVDVEILVNDALAYVFENDLLALDSSETLEILNISATYNAFYDGDKEVIEPYFVAGSKELLDRPFVSEVEIVFGRKYHGIPVIGSKFIVRMGKDSMITGVTKKWRDIDSSRTESLPLINAGDAYINSMFSQDATDRVFSHAQCGYFEDTAYATESQSTYICDFYYTNFEVSLTGELRVRENLIPHIPVYGQGPSVAPVVRDDSIAE